MDEFAQREEHLLALIQGKLKSGSYRFKPARRVLIPKEGTSRKRKLGIPVVMDRIVGLSMHRVLEGTLPDLISAFVGARASIRPYGIYSGWCKRGENGRYGHV